VGYDGLIDPKASSRPRHTGEARRHRAGDHYASHLDIALDDDHLHVVAETRHCGKGLLPDRFLGVAAGRGQAERRMDYCIRMEQLVESIEIARVTGGQPSKHHCSTRIHGGTKLPRGRGHGILHAMSHEKVEVEMSQNNMEALRGVRSALRPLGERAGQRRSLDEHLFVRFPALLRLIGPAIERVSPRSRIRRSVVARRVTRAYAAANRRDFDVVLAGTDLGVYEYRPSRDLLPPDLEPVFHGRDGYLDLWRYWLDAFEDIRWEPEEVVDFGDKLLVTTEQRGHGSGSGIAVSVPVFQLFTLHRGLVIRQEDFLSRTDALKAAGLRE
jgi:SnoaL-like domain